MDYYKPTLPALMIHGSNPESLRNEYMNVLKQIYKLTESLQKVDFHGRDYINSEEFNKARQERLEIYIQLAGMQNYFECIVESI
jgi:hypothetical protein